MAFVGGARGFAPPDGFFFRRRTDNLVRQSWYDSIRGYGLVDRTLDCGPQDMGSNVCHNTEVSTFDPGEVSK